MRKHTLNDETVVRRVLDGDKDAFGYLVDRHSDHVFKIALKYARNRRDALEITQDVFVKAYTSLAEIKDYSLLDHWLAKIAVNAALNWLRSRNCSLLITGDIALPDRQASSKQADIWDLIDGDREAIWKALEQLPEKFRTVVLMRYMDDYSYAEIAKRLSVSMATVRTRIARAKQLLKPMLVPNSSESPAQQTA